MISFIVHDKKEFMNLLLKQNAFDNFHVRQIDITTFALFQIDGTRNKEFYSLAEQELLTDKYCYWSEIRPYAFQVIKGQQLPKNIKIIFSLPKQKKELVSAIPANYFLNIHFVQNTLICTTGCSLLSFSMDKTAEIAWDEWVLALFHQLNIAITQQ